MYEYKFERIKAGFFGLQKAEREYQEVIHKHAREGWRLVQVFAPADRGLASGAKFYEMIFERKKG